MQIKLQIALCLLLAACGSIPASEVVEPFWKKIITDDIQILQSQKWSIDKNISNQNTVENQFISAPNWLQELKPIFDIEDKSNQYTQTTDSNGLIKIAYYYPMNKKSNIKQISVNTLAGKTQVLEIQTTTNNWLVRRQTTYSYMPQKGYSIQISEKYPWSSTKLLNISTQYTKTP